MHNCLYPFQGLISPNIYVATAFIALIIFSILLLRIKSAKKVLIYTRYLSLGLLWLGATGNLYQRVQYKCVLDNLNFFGLFKFNFFDISVTLGIVAALVVLFASDRKQG